MKGKIIQSAKLYLQKEGEEKARHVKHWSDYVRICDELGASTAYDERTFLNDEDFPPLGKPITEWPEEEPNYKVGKERLFFCVPYSADFQRIKDVGATVVHTYEWLSDQEKPFLDKAEKHGLKVLYCIKNQIHDPVRHGKPWEQEECGRRIERFNSHPALFGWYLFDEPDDGSISKETQEEVISFFRDRTDKPLVTSLRGGTIGWNNVPIKSLDLIIPDAYTFDGTGLCWGMKPLEYLEWVGGMEREYLNENNLDIPVMFMFQCDSDPAVALGKYNTKVPLGEIEPQFNALKDYGLFTAGVAMYAWDGGDFCPNRDEEIYNEIKDLFDKIKEE